MGIFEFLIMKLYDGIIVGGEGIGCEVVFELLVIFEFVYVCEIFFVQEVDFGLFRRFDLVCDEVKYFKLDVIILKFGILILESSVKLKLVFLKCCICVRLYDENSENCRWLEEFCLELL